VDRMKHVDEHIAHRAVRLDGEEFRNCGFHTCTLEIGGAADFVLEACTFTDCQWVFVDAAATTLAIMARLYAGMIPNGDALIEQVCASIRQGSGFGTPYKPVA
jgi:hypothetical protein